MHLCRINYSTIGQLTYLGEISVVGHLFETAPCVVYIEAWMEKFYLLLYWIPLRTFLLSPLSIVFSRHLKLDLVSSTHKVQCEIVKDLKYS